VSKEAEKAYLAAIGRDGRQHSLLKPFSDNDCGKYLASIGFIISLLPPPPARILDFGCGGGWTSIFLALRGYQVTGQDIAPDMIDLALENRVRNGLTSDRVDFICGDFESLEGVGDFDGALFFDCLHHADDEALAIRTAYAALKPGGLLITHEPGEGHSTNPLSIAAMEQFGVNERDMPPRLIVKRGMEAGFVGYRVLPAPDRLFSSFYEKRNHPALSSSRYRLIRNVIRMLVKPNMAGSAIVVLEK
jgi:SAM-dependent methyltransferase